MGVVIGIVRPELALKISGMELNCNAINPIQPIDLLSIFKPSKAQKFPHVISFEYYLFT
jgi:hypothetical protein